MTDSAIIAIAAALSIAFSTIGPAMGQGKTAAAAMESIARQPDAAGDIRSSLIISMAMMEALTIYGLLIAFMLVAKV
ncbi:MAG: ATP synthase F0 subunit C [Christensenellaceae bacterium]|jgi:F-type H+-transporting ATPase subunit c